MNLRQAVHDFISALELTDKQREAASDQHTHLRDELARRLRLDPDFNTFLTGSYARSTAIRPLKDIDVFCVLARTDSFDPSVTGPSEALQRVKAALEDIYGGKTADPQNRSVNIEFSGTGIGYDVVPAFADTDASREVFLIPDLRAARWIRSNPRVHRDLSVKYNEQAGTELKPLTKAVKHWNRRLPKGQRLRSFHVEVMAWDVLTSKPEDRVAGLASLFEGLADRVLRTTPDPAKLGSDLDDDLGGAARQAASGRLAEAGRIVRSALDRAASGKVAEAHALLLELFGDDYPGRGSSGPQGAPGASGGPLLMPSAPDGSGSRFG